MNFSADSAFVLDKEAIDKLLDMAMKGLELHTPSFGPEGFPHFCDRLEKLSLTSLTLKKLFIRDDDWQKLFTALLSLRTLEELDLSFNRFPTSFDLPELIKALPSLKTLKLYNVSVRFNQIQAFEEAILNHPCLENVHGSILSNQVVQHLKFNKELHGIESILQDLMVTEKEGFLSHTFLKYKKEQLEFHLAELSELQLFQARYFQVLNEVDFYLGNYFYQLKDLTEAEKHLSSVVAYSATNQFGQKARPILAALYYIRGIDTETDVLLRRDFLVKCVALNEPNLTDYAQMSLLNTCNEALAACHRTALILSQEIGAIEEKRKASSHEFPFRKEAPGCPTALLSTCHLSPRPT